MLGLVHILQSHLIPQVNLESRIILPILKMRQSKFKEVTCPRSHGLPGTHLCLPDSLSLGFLQPLLHASPLLTQAQRRSNGQSTSSFPSLTRYQRLITIYYVNLPNDFFSFFKQKLVRSKDCLPNSGITEVF